MIVDHERAFRRDLMAALSRIPAIASCAEATNARAAVAVAATFRPDVVLMSVSVSGVDGIAATRDILSQRAKTKVLLLTALPDRLQRVVAATGVAGYVLRNAPIEDLANVIALASRGYSCFAPGIIPLLDHGPEMGDVSNRLRGLTDREHAVLLELNAGATNKDIASVLHLSVGTVRNYISRILLQLGVRTRTEAALVARAAFGPPKTSESALLTSRHS